MEEFVSIINDFYNNVIVKYSGEFMGFLAGAVTLYFTTLIRTRIERKQEYNSGLSKKSI